MGIIGEYVGRIYGESKRRPLYVVRERMGFEAQTRAVSEKLRPRRLRRRRLRRDGRQARKADEEERPERPDPFHGLPLLRTRQRKTSAIVPQNSRHL